MLAYDADYQAAVESNTYMAPENPCRVQWTLPGDVYPDVSVTVESCTITASLVTDLPDLVREEDGYPSVGCDLTLTGDIDVGVSIADALNPYNADSVLYRQSILNSPITVQIGIYDATGTVAWLTKFTGTVDSFTVDPVTGAVDLTCIDYRNKLRALPNLGPVITVPPFNAGLTSEFAVDYLLRKATGGEISSSPALDGSEALAITFRSSLAPEVGTLTVGPLIDPTFNAGAFGSALAVADNDHYALVGHLSTHIVWEQWQSSRSSFMILLGASGTDDYRAFLAGPADPDGNAEGVYVNIRGNTTGDQFYWSTPISAGPHYLGVHVNQAVGSTTWSVTINLDGTLHSSGSMTASMARASTMTTATIDSAHYSTGGTLEAFRAWSASSPTWNDSFVPQAVLDPSLNTLQVISAMSGDPWQIIQQIVDAEQAVAGFDENGIFRLTNRRTIRHGSVVRTVTSATSLKAMQISVGQASVYDSVTVPYTSWNFGAAGQVYAVKAVHKVAANSTRTWTVTLADGTLIGDLDNDASVLPAGHSTTDGNTWFRASRDSGGLNEYRKLSVSVSTANSSDITITATNTGSDDAWLISPAVKVDGTTYTDIPAGTPALWIGGVPVTQGDEQTVSYPDSGGTNALTISSNPWIQDADTALLFATELYCDLSVARPDLINLEIVPDPRLQLVDRVEIVDPDTSLMDDFAGLWGQTLTFSNGDWTHSLDVRTVGAPGGWIGGVAGRSEGGTTTYGIG